MLPLLLSALALAPTAQEPPTDPAPTRRPDSIEAFLRRARAKRDAIQARLKPEVESIVAQLEEIAGRSSKSSERRILAEIEGLGPEAAPLFVPYLEPGEPVKAGPSYRAKTIAKALSRAPTDALTEGLFDLAENGTDEGQRQAILLLGYQPADPRIDAYLEQVYANTEGIQRLESVRAMARRGGHDELFRQALFVADPELVAEILAAFALRQDPSVSDAVLTLARDARAAAPVLGGLVAYYRACPSAADEATLDALLPLLLREDVELADKVDLLDAIPTFTSSLELRLRRLMEPVLESKTTELREAGLVCMTLLGNRSAKKELLRFYDKRVSDNDNWPKGYEDRGDVLVRIGDHSSAAKDFKRALELLEDRARLTNYRDLWLKLARAYVQAGRLRQGLEALEEFGLGPAVREQVLADPAFEPLVSSSRYGRAFR